MTQLARAGVEFVVVARVRTCVNVQRSLRDVRVQTCRTVRRVIASCAICGVGVQACRDPVAPTPLPAGAEEFTPDAVYRDWWRQMENCSGARGAFDTVRWYVVRGEEPFRVQGIDYPVVGYWDARSNRIVLLEYLPNQRAPVIRHEALHAILRRTDHPPEYFLERCGAAIGGPDSPD